MIYTARAKAIGATTVEEIPRPRRWENVENAFEFDGLEAIARHGSGSLYQDILFSSDVPTVAKIEEVRWIVRGRFEGEKDGRIACGYHLAWLEDGTRHLVSQGSGLGYATAIVGSSPETVAAVFPPAWLRTFNDHKSARNFFDCFIRVYQPPGVESEGTWFIDGVALEFDYSIPETPWTANLFIQGKPMTTQKIKQGSNTPFVQISVSDATGQPLDLRGCTLTLSAKSLEKEFGGEAEITDAINGKAVYRWNEGDTDVSGVYRVELTAHWLDGSIVKIPFDRFSLIEVVPSIS